MIGKGPNNPFSLFQVLKSKFAYGSKGQYGADLPGASYKPYALVVNGACVTKWTPYIMGIGKFIHYKS